MNRRLTPLAIGVLALLLPLTAACSDDSDDADSAKNDSTAQVDGASTGGEDSADGSGDDSGTEGPAVEEGTGVVTLTDGEAEAAQTVTITDGAFSPTSIEATVDQLVTFEAGDDGVYAVRFGTSNDTYTVTGGLIETFVIDAPGTYTVAEDISGQTMTVTITD